MADRVSLRDYQRELAARLQSATAAPLASQLGVQAGGARWLVDLADASEVIAVPAIAPVPLTLSWFKGVAGYRGKLYNVVDLGAFWCGAPAVVDDQARLLLLSERYRMGSALLVDRALGLRNLDQMQARPAAPGAAPDWVRAEYTDATGAHWRLLDLARLVANPEFLAVSA
jgi:twitching motility protein PilI